MRMQTKLPIVSLVGAGTLFLMCPGRYHRAPRASQTMPPSIRRTRPYARYVCGHLYWSTHNRGVGMKTGVSAQLFHGLPYVFERDVDINAPDLCDYQYDFRPRPQIQACYHKSVVSNGSARKQLHPFETKCKIDSEW